ncbi:MAG: phosphoenolpyruvate--protein phosphotransferase [Spirochaetales bacterium]|nr:phosphoenolpyruvate--protein phosphotransferase [Spirochaetales bacterium]
MNEYKGFAASPGISIGKSYLYIEKEYATPKYDIPEEEIKSEHERFLKAVVKATDEIKGLKNQKKKKISKEECRLMDSHILMLNDPEIKSKIVKNLHEKKKNVEWILFEVIEENIEKLNALEDPYLRERTTDLVDISQRILRHLLLKRRQSLADLTEEVIVVANSLLPSDILVMNKEMVIGIVTDTGSITSHIAILAKSLRIPAVVGLSNISELIRQGDEIIVDGNNGKVIVKPGQSLKRLFISNLKKWKAHEIKLLDLNELPATTLDGRTVMLESNIELPEELESVISHGADGIGLYRSEFLFIKPEIFPSEEQQYIAYKNVLEFMGDKGVCIRTLDYGGEKITTAFHEKHEENPILGWRAVRFYLSHPEVLKTQLRALLRASIHGNLRIMFPMISGVEELEKILGMTEEVKIDLRKSKIDFNEDIEIGIMIEVPSAALTSDILANYVDFFSIGTNDLIQYTIAVDRGNERVAYLYEPFHPAVLRLIQKVINSAKDSGIKIEMCGEMAGNIYATIILLGLGLESFSMISFRIPKIKKLIRSVSYEDTVKLTEEVMKLSHAKQIETRIKQWMEEHLDFDPDQK